MSSVFIVIIGDVREMGPEIDSVWRDESLANARRDAYRDAWGNYTVYVEEFELK